MGEVYYIWPDPDSIKDQLQLSALVQALEIKDQFALLRWAQKETSAPKLGAAWPKIDEDGVCYLAWVQVRVLLRTSQHGIDLGDHRSFRLQRMSGRFSFLP